MLPFFSTLFPANQTKDQKDHKTRDRNNLSMPENHRQKTPKSKMKLSLLVVLFVITSLGAAFPIMSTLPAAPALLSKNEQSSTNSLAPLAPRTLVKRLTNTELVYVVLAVYFVVWMPIVICALEFNAR
jgi:hypothetical protein